MSNLDKEFDSVLSEVESKVKQAQQLLNEVSALIKGSQVTLNKEEIDTLLDTVYNLPTSQNWDESQDTNGAWNQSFLSC